MPELEIMAEGVGFPEGPVACEDGSVIFGELRSGQIIRVRPDGTRQIVATVKGAAPGLAIGPDGALYCCNNGGFAWSDASPAPIAVHPDYQSGSIERIDLATGKMERLYDSCDGVKLAGPNDIVFDRHGGFWFSDLGVNIGTAELHGGIYYALPDGSSIRRIYYGQGVNGIGISPDGKTVYAGVSFAHTMLAFDADPATQHDPGTMLMSGHVHAEQGHGPAGGRLVASFPGRHIPDSLAIEADGTIAQALVFAAEGIARVNPLTGAYQMVHVPDFLTTNIAFGGPDMQTAYITMSATSRIGRMRWPAPGLRLPYNI